MLTLTRSFFEVRSFLEKVVPMISEQRSTYFFNLYCLKKNTLNATYLHLEIRYKLSEHLERCAIVWKLKNARNLLINCSLQPVAVLEIIVPIKPLGPAILFLCQTILPRHTARCFECIFEPVVFLRHMSKHVPNKVWRPKSSTSSLS